MSGTWSPLLTHFLPGVIVGWILNYTLTKLTKKQVIEEVVHTVHTDDDVTAEPATQSHRRIPAWLRSRYVLGSLAAIVLTVTLASSILVFQRQDEQSSCYARRFDLLSSQLTQLGKIAAEDRTSVDDMVRGVLVPGKTPQQRGQVLQDYLDGRHARDLRRAKAKYPTTAGCR